MPELMRQYVMLYLMHDWVYRADLDALKLRMGMGELTDYSAYRLCYDIVGNAR